MIHARKEDRRCHIGEVAGNTMMINADLQTIIPRREIDDEIKCNDTDFSRLCDIRGEFIGSNNAACV